jgi:isoquinoline 1-oxidoreductase/isoquinoline 1-oxidoreductase beta subunit
LHASGIAAGALVLGCRSSGAWSSGGTDANADAAVFDAWLAITEDDRILLHVHKVEMGQGTHTAFATLVGEELRVPPDRIELIAAPVDDAFANPMQMTGGSNSLASIWKPLRETGARAREMLRAAAAEHWDTAASGLVVEDGAVRDPATGATLAFGALARSASRRSPPRNVALTPRSEYRYIGKSFPRVDAYPKSTGRAQYGMDVRVPGLLTAVVVHCPHARGSLISFDDTAARRQPGVEDVFEIPGGIAIVAKSYWRARSAAGKLEVRWDPGESAGVDSAFIRAGLARALSERDFHSGRDDGDAGRALSEASVTIEAEYSLPYLAHATMEPMNCTVVPSADGCDVHAGTQAPSGMQDAVAAVLGLAREDVRVHTLYLGGGFGRRAFVDMATEAATIAKRVSAPVKLVWSREDDMARDYYRPTSLHRLRGAIEKPTTGPASVVAWEHRLAMPSMMPYMVDLIGPVVPAWMRGAALGAAKSMAKVIPGWVGPMLGVEGAVNHPYAIANVSFESVAWDPGIPVGIWRSVGHSHNGFVVESFIDELAHAAGVDPAAFRRRLLADHPRHIAVLDLLLEKGRWGSPPPGRHLGIAIHESFGTVAGQIAEVSINGDEIRVHRVTCVVDCGLAVNPDIVEAQMESGIVFGLTAALLGEITFRDGAAIESNFHDHPMLRMAQVPEIEVAIVPSSEAPSGVGEPGTPPIAPAVANAVFAATGRRLRELPLRLG